MLRFGIIGMGRMGRIRAREIQARSDVELIGVCDQNPEQSPEFEGVPVFREAAELLKLDFDAVMICAYNDVAAPFTLAALRSGKHVLCEKPPARFASELNEVARTAQKTGLVVKYGFNHRYHYSVMEAKKLFDSNSLGKMLWAKGTYGKAGHPGYESDWRNDIKLSGGGILIDQGIHMLDLMLMFSGDIERIHSTARASYWNTKVEDNVFAILEARNGLMMMLHSSATLWRHQFLLELCFEHGQISLDGILSSTRSYADERLVILRNDDPTSGYALGKPSEQRTTFDQDHSWKLELEEFVQAVLGHAPIRNGTLSDAMQLMRTIEEIYAQSGFYDETGR